MFEKCPNCLKRVIKGSKFCTHCGEEMPRVVKAKRKKVNKDFIDVDFTAGKKIFNRYKKYFFERLKDPKVSMKKSMNKESFRFGIIQLVLFMIINSLAILALYVRTNMGNADILNGSRIGLFISVTALQVFFLLNMVVSLYISTNYLKNVPTTTQTIISRVGGLAAPQVILSIILYFSVLLRISFLYYIMLSMIFLISLAIISFYLMSMKNNSIIPVFYTVVLSMSLLLVLQVVVYNVIMRFSTNPQVYPEIIRITLGLF